METETQAIVPLWTPPTFSLGGDRDIEGDFPLDQIVIDQLPPGTQVHSCDRYGASAWTVTARITTTLANGEPKLYFLKCAEEDQGRAMLEGEFNSMVELYKTSPNFVPKPYTWGKLSVSSPDTYYFLCDFIDMINSNPDPIKLCTKLVQLHQASESPTGMFGFHINTCQGNLPQQTAWNPSWVDFYIQLVRGAMALNKEINGNYKNLEELVDRLITHVVPQVLGPLETDGRVVKPTLIHGDLWDGNIGTSLEDGEIYAFDATKFCKTMNSKIYLNTYLSRMGVSEPVEQFEDRHRIYSVYMTLHESAYHNGSSFREE
ncbi:Fructosamine kinase-domain-containing protein [Aspergillus egyptiacus]|nr:Fructosamine kinase-domain-containing protein [Aspergillus egyptiacus]